MTDQGSQPTRADTEAIGGAHDPTVVGVPPVGPEAAPGDAGGEGPPPGSPPPPWGPPPRDRRLWIIVALLVAIVIVLVLLLLLRDDDGDGDGDATTTTSETTTTLEEETTTTAEETTTTESTTTTTEATTTTAAAPPVTADPAQCREAGSDPGNPNPAAQAVFIAWTRGDEACARELMTDQAFDQLFARDGRDATDDFQSCVEEEVPEPVMDCAFTYPGGATHYVMRFVPTGGWEVVEVYQVAD